MKEKNKPCKANIIVDGEEKEIVFWSALAQTHELESAGYAYLSSILEYEGKPRNIMVVSVKRISYKEFFDKKKDQDVNFFKKLEIQKEKDREYEEFKENMLKEINEKK